MFNRDARISFTLRAISQVSWNSLQTTRFTHVHVCLSNDLKLLYDGRAKFADFSRCLDRLDFYVCTHCAGKHLFMKRIFKSDPDTEQFLRIWKRFISEFLVMTVEISNNRWLRRWYLFLISVPYWTHELWIFAADGGLWRVLRAGMVIVNRTIHPRDNMHLMRTLAFIFERIRTVSSVSAIHAPRIRSAIYGPCTKRTASQPDMEGVLIFLIAQGQLHVKRRVLLRLAVGGVSSLPAPKYVCGWPLCRAKRKDFRSKNVCGRCQVIRYCHSQGCRKK